MMPVPAAMPVTLKYLDFPGQSPVFIPSTTACLPFVARTATPEKAQPTRGLERRRQGLFQNKHRKLGARHPV
jgi:hypothetical protein